MTTPRCLVLYYSLSGQTRRLATALAAGLGEGGIEPFVHDLRPVEPLPFPLPSAGAMVSLMVRTLFRERHPIEPLPPPCRDPYDLVVLAGPTWSYNPSGPVLAFLDRDGPEILRGLPVLPLLSCRGYWRTHGLGLGRRIRSCGGEPLPPWVFPHPVAEPWRSLGTLLTLAGMAPRRFPFLARRYPRYGHSPAQVAATRERGRALAGELRRLP